MNYADDVTPYVRGDKISTVSGLTRKISKFNV